MGDAATHILAARGHTNGGVVKKLPAGSLIALVALVVGCGGSATPQPTVTVTVTAAASAGAIVRPTPKPTKGAPVVITDGVYLVGTDIPVGTYKGRSNSDDTGFWQISSDPNGQHIVASTGPLFGPFYVLVKKGEYLELRGVTITKVK